MRKKITLLISLFITVLFIFSLQFTQAVASHPCQNMSCGDTCDIELDDCQDACLYDPNYDCGFTSGGGSCWTSPCSAIGPIEN